MFFTVEIETHKRPNDHQVTVELVTLGLCCVWMILSAKVMFFGDSFNSIEQCTEYEERIFLAMSVSLLQNLLSSIKKIKYMWNILILCVLNVQFNSYKRPIS